MRAPCAAARQKSCAQLRKQIFTTHIGTELLNNMLRELAILGFVSFTATVILQFVALDEKHRELFEFSHVLMFVTAVFYALEIATVSVSSARARHVSSRARDGLGEQRRQRHAVVKSTRPRRTWRAHVTCVTRPVRR